MQRWKIREWKNREQIAWVENARVENTGAGRRGEKRESEKCGSIGSRGGKCSRLAAWKAEPIYYTAIQP